MSSPAVRDRTTNLLTIYSHNVSGAKHKVPRLNTILTTSAFDIIALQETWFNSSVEDIELTKNTNFQIIRQDRGATSHPLAGGGGVCLFINNNFSYKQHTFPEIKFLNYLCVVVLIEDSQLLLLNIYSPHGYINESTADIVVLLNKIEAISRSETIILGDFNMPDIKWSADEELPGAFSPYGRSQGQGQIQDQTFIEAFLDHNYQQIIPPPLDRNHLDLTWVSDLLAFSLAEIIQEDLVDRASLRHHPVGINFHISVASNEKIKFLNFGRTNLSESKRQLADHLFHDISYEQAVQEDMSGNQSASYLIKQNFDSLFDIMCRNTPLKTVKRTWISKHPWLRNSSKYEEALDQKKKARKLHSLCSTEESRNNYKAASIDVMNVFTSERTEFLNRVIDESNGNTCEFYNLMKSGSKLRKDTPDVMTYMGATVQGLAKNQAFASHLGGNFLSDVPIFGSNHIEVNETIFDLYQTNFDEDNMFLWENLSLSISEEKVKQYINELKPRKDPGPMKIHQDFLKFNIDVIAPVIVNAINTMIITGNIPEDWKKCYLIPIPKKGSPMKIENYRGIAIQSCIPKILDKYITDILYNHLGRTINADQHGFMKGRSTTTNLLEITQFLHDNTKNGQVDVIYFDYSKAFDQLRHDLLAIKLSKTGMPFNLFRLIMNFVVGRQYLLKIDGVETNIAITPLSSVPQGSHFGPVLYLLFTNGIGVGELCYADDTKIFKKVSNLNDRTELQNRINILSEWSQANGLTLNPEKTYHVSYGKEIFASLYILNGQIIQEKESVRDLGVIFDKNLTFAEHIKHVTTRINQMIGAARRLVTDLKMPLLMSRIYSVYIRPIAEYCSIIWDQDRRVMNAPITLAHKKATRIALNVHQFMPIRDYISYNQRCDILAQDSPATRRATQAALTGIKIFKGLINPSFGSIVWRHLNDNTSDRIWHLLFRIDNSIPKKSPLFQILSALTNYENAISLDLSFSTNKERIKKANADRRSLLSASRTTRPTRD